MQNIIIPILEIEKLAVKFCPRFHMAEPGLVPIIFWPQSLCYCAIHKYSVLISLEKDISSHQLLNIKKNNSFFYKQN